MTTEINSQGDGAGDQGGASTWYADLADDLKADAKVTQYATAEDAARALIHYNGHFGVPANQLVRLPKPDDAAGNEALWNTLGRPETPDKYQVKLADGGALDQDAASAFMAHMHKAGPFTPAMAQAAMDWYASYGQQVGEQALQAGQQAAQANIAALKGEWGQAYQQNLDAAAGAALKFGGDELKAFLNDSGMGDDPRMLKAWLNVAEAGREAGPPPKDPGRDQGQVFTPGQAAAELAKIEGDPNIMKSLTNANDPQHEYWTQRRLQLIQWKNG